jgi:hypothetical protein
MAGAAAFLGDARGRLLPASIPFRFFGAAVALHALAWLVLLAGAAQAPGFAGGLGLPLAALHLITLGVLVMTALGASLQLLPVATRQAVGSPAVLVLLWWLYAPGVLALALAMALPQPGLLALAAALLVLALLLYAWLLGRNLARARGMPVVVVHGWAALACLLGLLASGLSLALAYRGQALFDRSSALALHVSLAAYGFMGLLVLGFSYILVPMFALADAPPLRPSLASAGLAIAGLVLAAAGALGLWATWLWPLALLAGLLGLGLHVRLMVAAQRAGMRRQLGRSFVLVRLGWAGLAASLLLALLLQVDPALPRGATLFGVLLVGGLLSLLLGMLSRIVPFLAAMHAVPGRRGPPLPSALTDDRALAWHFACHLSAWALLLLAVLADSAWLVRAAALPGSVGALAFGWFFVVAMRRMRAAPRPAEPRL